MNLDNLEAQAAARHLAVLGGFHPGPDDEMLAPARTILLVGPAEPGFWPAFTSSPEWHDGDADPMDRWSRRVIAAWAAEIGAEALFPFGGPPYLPFFTWALRTGRIHASPVRLLVHDTAGLLVSFRGALALPQRIALPPPPPSPCLRCEERPCLTSCPVGALDGAGYDVPGCKAHLADAAGEDCMKRGCAVRRACPVSRNYPRLSEQSAYHMSVFKG
jgi:hypothetical protein